MLQGLRFAGPCKGGTQDLVDQIVDPFQKRSVGSLPVEVILPGVLGKDKLHSTSSLCVPPPESNSAIDSRSLRTFLGLLRR